MKTTHIGNVAKGGTFDGVDSYALLQLEDSDTPPDGADDLELAGQLFEGLTAFCNGPGGRFCSSVRVIPLDVEDRRYIGIAFIRWDV